MTRTEAITQITSTISKLNDERVRVLADIAQSWTHPTVFSTLVANDKAGIDAALDELDCGESILGKHVFAELRQSIVDAKAST